jgi:alkanesulfonate monooxygenase SsuD/methylene tetrahydromethanopterin reductase-like flavin-dependent oxidoreductase (luciferase family)
MRVYHFTEQPYPDAWIKEADSIRVTLPNRFLDPVKAADLYHEYLDAWQLADELGLDIFVNEHHSTATCMTASANLILGILARTTKKARLLGLGFPIANNPHPLRVAEELAMIDVISRGRLEMGFVKGVPYELHPANSLPVRHTERFWEAHDLIMKALTSHDGPFSWEGEFFQYRNVNVWPRPYQQPHPPVWISANSVSSARSIAERGYVLGTVMTGYKAKDLFAEYRRAWRDSGRPEPVPLDRLCYAGFVGVGKTRAEGHRRGDMVMDYLRTNAIVGEAFKIPAGFVPARAATQMVKQTGSMLFMSHDLYSKDGRKLSAFTDADLQCTIDGGLMFTGTPDDVYQQMVDFFETVGGFGHFLMMAQAGRMSYQDTAENLTLFAKEVLPRLQEYTKAKEKSLGIKAPALA